MAISKKSLLGKGSSKSAATKSANAAVASRMSSPGTRMQTTKPTGINSTKPTGINSTKPTGINSTKPTGINSTVTRF